MHSIIKERLQLIIKHAEVIEARISQVKHPEYFKNSEQGELLLDSLITRLQALSENIKKIEKISPSFFLNSFHIDVTPVIRFRDLASHHYELLNYHIIFSICEAEIPPLKIAVAHFLKND